MRGSRNFRQGGPGQSDERSSDNVFKSSAYFTEVKWLISMKAIIFQGSRVRSNFFQGGGGVQLFPGGIPYRNPYNL